MVEFSGVSGVELMFAGRFRRASMMMNWCGAQALFHGKKDKDIIVSHSSHFAKKQKERTISRKREGNSLRRIPL